MTDGDILERIKQGTLGVDTERGDAVWGHSNNLLKIIERRIEGSPSYRFVSICHKGKKKMIAVHRLVWMFVHGRVVPLGYVVDHKSHAAEFPDGIDNLQLKTHKENNRTRGVKADSGSMDAGTPF